MPTTADYLNDLINQKNSLAATLQENGVEASADETFSTLVPKANERIANSEKIGIDDLEDYSSFFASGARANLYDVIDTSKGKNFNRCFAQSGISEFPDIDTSNGENFGYICNSCAKLLTVSKLNTSKAKDLSYAFYNSINIEKIENIDLNNKPNVNAMLNQCRSLTEFYPYNIRTSLQIASGTTWGHLLIVESLVHIAKECVKGLNIMLTMGSANREKIANVYCRITDYEHEKMTMELCESTAEDAMPLEDYLLLKNVNIQ